MGEKKPKNQTVVIMGLCLLIALLVLSVIGVFAILEHAAPDGRAPQREALLTKGGESSGYALVVLQEPQGEHEAEWLRLCNNGDDSCAYWLARRDEGNYLLYLPMQTLAVSSDTITATEEKGEDGKICLVLRIRTPEGGEAVEPEAQLLWLQADSDSEKGNRVRVILDGREVDVRKMILMEGELYFQESGLL